MSIVKEFLAQKDGDYSQYIPASYKLSAQDKAKALAFQSVRSRFEYEHAAKCMKPCFKTFASPVVTESESECMTNCVAKGLETLSHLQLFYARSA
jgi:hypothetical protein